MLTKGDDLSLDYKLDKVVMNMYSAGESSSGHFVAFGSDDTPHALTVSAPGLKHSQKLPTIHIEFGTLKPLPSKFVRHNHVFAASK